MAWVRAKCCHGSSWVAFSDSETRSRSMSTSSTSTVTSRPDLDDLGRVVDVLPGQLGDVDQTVDATEVDERTEVDDAADDTGADLTLLELLEERGANLGLGLLEPGARDRTTLLRFLSSSMILASISLPTYGWRSRTRRISTSEAGRKPRRPMSRMSPPLTTSMTVPVTTPSSSLIFSIVPQARSDCARFLDRIRRPSLSSFWSTEASTCIAHGNDLRGSTSCLMESSREGMTPSVL
jgi:hypothetical protein